MNILKIGTLSIIVAAFAPLYAVAEDMPGRHPAYLHAITDLQTAKWMLEHRPGNAAVSADEDVAITRIDQAINEVKHAAASDEKNLNFRPPVDANLDGKGRLHRAEELLRKVHQDVAQEEDNPLTVGMRDRAVVHIDAAIRATHAAIGDAANSL
jgi:hypothetical protein